MCFPYNDTSSTISATESIASWAVFPAMGIIEITALPNRKGTIAALVKKHPLYSYLSRLEIDLVAINDQEKKIVMAEIKRNKDRISLQVLRNKSERLLAAYPDYTPEWLALGVEDITKWLQI